MIWITAFLLRRRSPSGNPFGRVPCLSCPSVSALLRGFLRRPASAKLLLGSRTLPVLAPPFRSPQKTSFLPGEPRPLPFRVPEPNRQTRKTLSTPTQSPLSVSSPATP